MYILLKQKVAKQQNFAQSGHTGDQGLREELVRISALLLLHPCWVKDDKNDLLVMKSEITAVKSFMTAQSNNKFYARSWRPVTNVIKPFTAVCYAFS